MNALHQERNRFSTLTCSCFGLSHEFIALYCICSFSRSFVRDYLGAPAGIDIDELKSQNETFKKQLEAKDAEIADLKKQVFARHFSFGFFYSLRSRISSAIFMTHFHIPTISRCFTVPVCWPCSLRLPSRRRNVVSIERVIRDAPQEAVE
jgi:hypothetical protein